MGLSYLVDLGYLRKHFDARVKTDMSKVLRDV